MSPAKKKKSKSPTSKRKLKMKAEDKVAPPAPDSDLIDMQEAIEILKTSRPTFYRWLRTGKIKGMKIGRQWRFYREDIERFLKGEEPRIDLPVDINPLIKELRDRIKKAGIKTKAGKDQSEIEQAVNYLIILGVVLEASDIHITPVMEKDSAEVTASLRLRIYGVLQQITEFDIRLVPAIMEQWKRMANCDVHEKIKPQDGRILTNLADLSPGSPAKTIDLRVCFLPSGLGESLTVRILDAGAISLTLDQIDFKPEDREKLLNALREPWGLIVISGPTGSGKSTVLYSCIQELTGPERKIMSVEDPIEFYLPWVTQVGVNEEQGLTFSNIARAIFRSDPDVIMIGEIRDRETLQIAHELALTGHLVLTPMHVSEAANVLKQMVDIGSDPFVVSESVKLVMTQRLVRKLCMECSEEYTPEPDQLELAAEVAREGGLNWHTLPANYRKAVGCDKCSQTGYRRRNIINEILVMSPAIGKALRNDAPVEEIKSIAIIEGMMTIAADGIRRAANGETSLTEVMRVTGLGKQE